MKNINSSPELKVELSKNDYSCIIFYTRESMLCEITEKILQTLEKTYPEIEFIKFDLDNEPLAAIEYRVLHVPTVLGFRKEKEVIQIIGIKNLIQFADFLNCLITRSF